MHFYAYLGVCISISAFDFLCISVFVFSASISISAFVFLFLVSVSAESLLVWLSAFILYALVVHVSVMFMLFSVVSM